MTTVSCSNNKVFSQSWILSLCKCMGNLNVSSPGEVNLFELSSLLFLSFSLSLLIVSLISSNLFISCPLCSFATFFFFLLFSSYLDLAFCKPLTVIIWGHLEVQINRGLGACVVLQSAVLAAKQQEKRLSNKWRELQPDARILFFFFSLCFSPDSDNS